MKNKYDLSALQWILTGYVPYEWHLGCSMEVGVVAKPDIDAVKAPVPGSVQKALLEAGVIPDWNIGLNSKLCEWIENRHWLYEVKLPDEWFEDHQRYRLNCLGLDYCGHIYVNGKDVYQFQNSFVPHTVDITDHLNAADNVLKIMFECPPRWQGQFGYTSHFRDFKPRFNYTWDWTSRLVQVGIWDVMTIETVQEAEIAELNIQTDYDCSTKTGQLDIKGDVSGADDNRFVMKLLDKTNVLHEAVCTVNEFRSNGIHLKSLEILPWWPNGLGQQTCYDLEISLLDPSNSLIDLKQYQVGFKSIHWQSCNGVSEAADPWICVVNDKPIFLQGFNWTPIRPNFADVTEQEYRKRLKLYRDMGCNILRVWGGAFLEKECFYRLCDEYGLMVWQEFSLSSSGIENYPPDDQAFINDFLEVAASYIRRRHHHISLLLWSGGNELTTKGSDPKPLDLSHPLLGKLGHLVHTMDPQHRFVATSPTGPEFFAHEKNYGKGLHWDVHGPWKTDGLLDEAWRRHWTQDDSLFRSEMGAPGPSSVEIIRKYKGPCDELPADLSNPIWRRTGWWAEGEIFRKETNREPESLEEYVNWGQQRQSVILHTAVKSCKDRFPSCGGVILWMGHDCFPCMANTSVIDFEGNEKQACKVIKEVFTKGKQHE